MVPEFAVELLPISVSTNGHNRGMLTIHWGLFSSISEEKPSSFELRFEGGLKDDVPVQEVLDGLEDMSKRRELSREAFKIFDKDGDGYIDATELKWVLGCLGLDKGWDVNPIEKMVKVVDLNFDGKVDSGEFELMMG